MCVCIYIYIYIFNIVSSFVNVFNSIVNINYKIKHYTVKTSDKNPTHGNKMAMDLLIHPCMCAHIHIYLPNPSTPGRTWYKVNFKVDYNWFEFRVFFNLTKAKEHNLLYCLPITKERRDGFIGNGLSNPSLTPGCDCLHFILRKHESNCFTV